MVLVVKNGVVFIILFIYSAVKRLIMKSFVYIIYACVLCILIMYK